MEGVQPSLPGIQRVGSFLQFAAFLQSRYLISDPHNDPVKGAERGYCPHFTAEEAEGSESLMNF